MPTRGFRRSLGTGTSLSFSRVALWGEISPGQYAILTASADRSSEVWRNEVRRALIDANYISEQQYRRLLADLANEAPAKPTAAPGLSRSKARRVLVRTLAFERDRV